MTTRIYVLYDSSCWFRVNDNIEAAVARELETGRTWDVSTETKVGRKRQSHQTNMVTNVVAGDYDVGMEMYTGRRYSCW